MADKKISDLTNYTPATDTDVLPIVDTANTTTKKITWANIKATLKTYFDTLYVAPNQDTTGKSAKTDALNSASTVVNVAAATAPSTGQVLTAVDSTHATWQAPASGSAWATVGSAQLSADAALIIDTSGISSNYDVFRITVYMIAGAAGGGAAPSIRFNGDSGANYNAKYSVVYNANAVTENNLTGQTTIQLTYSQATGQAGDTVMSEIYVGKSLSGKEANIKIHSSLHNSTDGRWSNHIIGGTWANTSAKISEIAIGWFSDSTTYMGAGSWVLIEGAVL